MAKAKAKAARVPFAMGVEMVTDINRISKLLARGAPTTDIIGDLDLLAVRAGKIDGAFQRAVKAAAP